MITKYRIFKKGDVIVSGLGNIRIFTGEKFEGDSYKCLTCYCVSDSPAGTDMRYARHATAKEKKLFCNALKANGLCFDKANLCISYAENVSVENLVTAKIDWKADGPQPYKVVKKRVRPTLKEVNELKSGLENERRLHIHFAKECEANIKVKNRKIDLLSKENSELKDHLDEVKVCNEKMAKDLAILQGANEKLKSKIAALEQSNKLMEAELTLQKGRVSELSQSDKESKEYIDYLLGRGFLARLFNLE